MFARSIDSPCSRRAILLFALLGGFASCTPDRSPNDSSVGAATTSPSGSGGRGGAAGSGNATTTGAGGAGASDMRDASGSAGQPGIGDASTDVVAAGVRWIGRVDTSDSAGPRFGWSGTGFVAQFFGTSIGVNLKNDDAYFFQAVVDGKKGPRFQVAKGQSAREIATGLAAGSHTLELTRETEASYGTSQFLGITQGTLQAAPKAPERFIEFVGDSMTAGYGNLGNEPHPDYGNPSPCTYSFDTQSAYLAYGSVAARALLAEASIVAVSGWGVFRSRSSGMNEVLPKVYANSVGLATSPSWNFQKKAQAVVINLGTNDFAPGDPGNGYTTALGAFVDTVRARYPSAWIFCAVGTMYSTAQHQKALSYATSVVKARGEDSGKVALVDLGSQDTLRGTGCDWHPSVAENERMAGVLVPVVKQKLGW